MKLNFKKIKFLGPLSNTDPCESDPVDETLRKLLCRIQYD